MVPKSHRVPDEPLRWFAVKRRRGLLSYEYRILIASAAFSSYRPVDFAIRMASHFLRGRKKIGIVLVFCRIERGIASADRQFLMGL